MVFSLGFNRLNSSFKVIEHMRHTAAFAMKMSYEYLGSLLAAILAIRARKDPYNLDGRSIMPLDKASGVG
jgi:hypothetical protein